MSKEQLQQSIREILKENNCKLIGLPEMKVNELRLVHKYLSNNKFVWVHFVGIAKLFECKLVFNG